MVRLDLHRRALYLLLLWIILPGLLSARGATPADSTGHPAEAADNPPFAQPNELSIWGGISFDSFQSWGKTPDTEIRSLGIRYNRKLVNIHQATLEYNLLLELYSSYTFPNFISESNERKTLLGLGVSPLGFQLNFRSGKIVQPFIQSSAGLTFLDEPFPDFRGKKLNFTFSAGGGFEVLLTGHISLSLGLKYHHLSNGDRGNINPGVDSTIYYTAFTFF